jgi:hypothetical protein
VGSPIVRIRNNNEFRPGVAVVTETERGLELSNSDVNVRNPGLMDAFSTGATAYAPIKSFMDAELDEVTTILTGLPTTIADYANHRYAYNLLGKPGWTQVVSNPNAPPNVQLATNPTVPLTGGRTYLPTELAANRVNVITCSGGGGNGRVTLLGSGTNNVFRNMAVFTNCQVRFDGNAVLEDFVLSTTDRSSSGQWAIHTASGLTVGKNDGCAPAGGAALITRGGFQAAAQTSFYGAIVRAVEEVDFQSNAVGEGVSIISGGGKVDTNSNINMAVCGPDSGAPPRNVSLRMRM